jgi:integrase
MLFSEHLPPIKGVRVPRRIGEVDPQPTLKTLAGRRVWWARWVKWENGRRARPEKIIGTLKEFPTKKDAKRALDEFMAAEAGRPAKTEAEPTFASIWRRYVTLKTPAWSRANKKTVTSIFDRAVLPSIGEQPIASLTLEPLQACLNHMVEVPIGTRTAEDGKSKTFVRVGYGESAIKKARRYISATFEFAIGEGIVQKNQARKLELPRTRKTCERFYTLDEVRLLLSVATGRERVVLRLLIVCGLRPAEVFALRTDDIHAGRLRIDEAIKDSEKGRDRLGSTKTEDSDGQVVLSAELERELRNWASTRRSGSLMFPTSEGTPWRIGNYLKRVLKPLAETVGIHDMTHQAMRRTFATHFQKHGSVKDTQTQLRHSDPETTLKYYQKEIPDSVRAAVESFESEMKGKPH